MSDDTTKKEWDRVKDNPDNVIMSDELIERIDSSTSDPDLSSITSIQAPAPNCIFRFVDYDVQGCLVSFSSIHDSTLIKSTFVYTISYTLSMSMHDATKFLTGSKLIGASISTNIDDKVLEYDYDDKPKPVTVHIDWPLDDMGLTTVILTYDIVK